MHKYQNNNIIIAINIINRQFPKKYKKNAIKYKLNQLQMKKKSYKRRRDDSQSDSSSSYSQQSSKRSQDLYTQLKNSLLHNDRYTHSIIRQISKSYKHQMGILRVTISGSFLFEQKDIQDFFSKYGKIQNVIIKQNNVKLMIDDIKPKQQQSIAYIIYIDYFSAVLALKVLNSVSEKERIIKAQICSRLPQTLLDKPTSQPLLYSCKIDDMILQLDETHEFGTIIDDYKYVGTIGLDLMDRNFRIKQRILGVDGCNFVRIYYLCDKSFKFENQGEQFKANQLQLRLLVSKSNGSGREVLIMSHCLQKYNHAVRFLHELMEQIAEQYKNSRQKSTQIIAKDIHIRRWEKFTYQPQLKFLT